MKKVFLLFMSVAALMSCSKDDKPNDPSPENCSLVSLKSGYTDVSISYDQNGKVSKIVDNSEGNDYRVTIEFQYTSNKITAKRTQLNKGQSTTESVDYTIDNSGKVISSTNGWTINYNPAGYVNEMKMGQLTDQFTYANDNLVMIKTIYGSYTGINNIEYETNEAYVPFTIDSESLGDFEMKVLYEQGYFGKKPKNRIKSSTEDKEVTSFTYEKDSKGKVVKISAKEDGETDNLFLEYFCK
ncbi:DUF4595 domain-containing protein [Sphingobacterium spiritivorum]|uniref:DUF4595 domain-containing protein n=1 Tax=Sphingobacterium spiritivorum TaxID=258 RepID=UPI003DA3D29C